MALHIFHREINDRSTLNDERRWLSGHFLCLEMNRAVPRTRILNSGPGQDFEDFKESFVQLSKEAPHLILKAIDEANIHGTFFGQLWGRTFAVIFGWVWFLICLIFICLYYFIIFCFVVFIINVVQSGLNIVHGAIRGVLAPLKAMYGVKILNFRPFGFLGSPVKSLQKSDQEIPNTTLELLIKTMKDQLK